MKVARDATVEIRYRLLDAAGNEVESTEAEGPLRYRHGRDEILPGLERALDDARPGDRIRVTLTPEEAFGAHDPEGIVVVPRSELPEREYRAGDWLAVQVEADEGDDVEEGELEMRILEVDDEALVMDANHPLAGQSVTFEVEVVSVEPPSARSPLS